MKKLIKHIFIVFYSCTLLGACAATNGDPPMERDINERGSDCISIRTIRDYTPLDNSSLLIEGSGNRFYYVTLGMSSFELRGSHRIGVESRDEWLCPYGGDGLVFDGFSTMGPTSIRGISRVSAEQADELLYRHDRKERPQEHDSAPPELDGAEIEDIGEEPPPEQSDRVPPGNIGAKVEELGQIG